MWNSFFLYQFLSNYRTRESSQLFIKNENIVPKIIWLIKRDRQATIATILLRFCAIVEFYKNKIR